MMEFNPTNDPSVLGDFDFGFQSQNVGNTQILGAEISLQGEIQGSEKIHSSGWVGYTFLIPTYLDWEKVREIGRASCRDRSELSCGDGVLLRRAIARAV